jgi:archaellum component FlaC
MFNPSITIKMGKQPKKQGQERNNALLQGANVPVVKPGNSSKARQAEAQDRRESQERNFSSNDDAMGDLMPRIYEQAKTDEPQTDEEQARDLAEDQIKRQLEADSFDEKPDLFTEIAEENHALQKTIKDLHEEAEMLASERNKWREQAEAEEKARLALAAQIAELSKDMAEMKEAKDKKPAQMEVIKPSAETEKVKIKFTTAADVISNAQNLIKIGMRIEYLKEKKAQLDSFIFGSSQTGESMTMKDAGGQEFTSNNPMLLKKIKDMVLHDIKNAIEQAELQLFDLA